MTNPFLSPFHSPDGPLLLCPWKHDDHEQYYAPVDNTVAAFEEFTRRFSVPDIVAEGRTIFVYGNQKCGKSALIHRSARWLETSLLAQGLEVGIVDLSGENWPDLPGDEFVVNLCSLTVDWLEIKRFLTNDALQQLADRVANGSRFFNRLSAVLDLSSKVLVIVAPRIETGAQLDKCVGLARRSIFLFLESEHETVDSHYRTNLSAHSSLRVLRLTVGALNEDDGWRFIKARMDLHQQQHGQPTLKIEESTVRALMRKRLTAGAPPMNIQELQLLAYNAYDEAMRQQSQVVSYTNFSNFYVRRGLAS